jgi:hypothetical protein
MESGEFDVYVSYRSSTGSALAKAVSESLIDRGFRVFLNGNGEDSAAIGQHLEIIENTPDFLLLLTPNALDACVESDDPMRKEILHALRTDRHVVPVSAPGYAQPAGAVLPPEFASLAARPGVSYVPHRSRESLARIANMLSTTVDIEDRSLMKRAKWIGGFIGVLSLLLLSIPVTHFVSRVLTARRLAIQPLPPLVLYWSGFCQRPVNGDWTELAVGDRMQMRGGDQFRLVFSTSRDGFAYVAVRDLEGTVTMLFPTRVGEAASRVRAGQVYEAPGPDAWSRVDPSAGIDSIYVVSSYDTIENLEELADARGEQGVAARRSLLESAIGGLLDGRHAMAGPRVRTRRGNTILQSMEAPALLLSASTRFASGAVVTHRLAPQRGMLSAVAEIHVQYER